MCGTLHGILFGNVDGLTFLCTGAVASEVPLCFTASGGSSFWGQFPSATEVCRALLPCFCEFPEAVFSPRS